ncbi:zinc-binding dehydrogenase [Streptomyces sp. NPDC088747]|uniref:zinc-binding dehydrogenase n=1 Tax=Streptomyces sp. NPDC088747 TaxID=3365886 RepID=UPI00380FB27E
MRALLVDHAESSGLRLGETEDPVPAPHEALIKVRATSLNFGEVKDAIAYAPNGTVPGWDAAGVVVRAAADGSGPAKGTPVVSVGANGAWAELRAVDSARLGTAPPDSDLGAISTIPVAAGSALRALHRIGPLLGKRILVTGATGGVGRYAVQLARLGGAYVLASTSDPATHGAGLRALGAHEVVTGPRELTLPVNGVVDVVGGPQLVESFEKLSADGTLIAVGHSARQPESFPLHAFNGDGGRHNRTIATFFLADCPGLAPDFTWLANQVAAGVLDPQISWRGGWDKAAEAVSALLERRLHGKAVLDIA